jgi:nicotinate-nucleotide pyrophosphorylase (carboxylating)
MNLARSSIEESLRSFIAEDVGHGDITSNALIEPGRNGEGTVVCKEDAVVAGIEEAVLLLEITGCNGRARTRDGSRVKVGTVILSASGPARALLGVERTLLNLVSHMSGIATTTADLVSIADKASNGRVRVACTRKTLPGLRYFEKRAVELGGGDTHRLRLDDAVLIKDNHLAFSGGLDESIRKVRAQVSFTKKIEIEVTSPNQAVQAAKARADIILLDNMTPQQVKKSVDLLKAKTLREHVLIEASGGIRRENISSYAKTGVDVVSIGAITHSAKAIDMSMKIRSSKKHA